MVIAAALYAEVQYLEERVSAPAFVERHAHVIRSAPRVAYLKQTKAEDSYGP